MSIEKDVEKKYIDDLERQNKKLKKKRKKRLLLLLLILLLLGSIGLMMGLLGLFPWMNDGDGDGGDSSGKNSSSSAVSSSQAETTTTKEQFVYDDVKVSGSTYIYQGQVKTLEEIKTIISNMKDNVVIRISDDNATKNAMDNLKNMLADAKRTFISGETNDSSSGSSSSASESSSQAESSSSND